jgi:hypothetical protein
MRGITKYSKVYPGTRANHNYHTRFDVTDGLVGISQWDDKKSAHERVLLSKEQSKALLKFVGSVVNGGCSDGSR